MTVISIPQPHRSREYGAKLYAQGSSRVQRSTTRRPQSFDPWYWNGTGNRRHNSGRLGRANVRVVGNDPRLVGVVAGEEEIDFLFGTIQNDNVIARGSGFTSLAAWGRSNWPL